MEFPKGKLLPSLLALSERLSTRWEAGAVWSSLSSLTGLWNWRTSCSVSESRTLAYWRPAVSRTLAYWRPPSASFLSRSSRWRRCSVFVPFLQKANQCYFKYCLPESSGVCKDPEQWIFTVFIQKNWKKINSVSLNNRYRTFQWCGAEIIYFRLRLYFCPFFQLRLQLLPHTAP